MTSEARFRCPHHNTCRMRLRAASRAKLLASFPTAGCRLPGSQIVLIMGAAIRKPGGGAGSSHNLTCATTLCTPTLGRSIRTRPRATGFCLSVFSQSPRGADSQGIRIAGGVGALLTSNPIKGCRAESASLQVTLWPRAVPVAALASAVRVQILMEPLHCNRFL